MNEYTVDGQVYQVSSENLDHFLEKYPNAKLSEKTEPVKTTPVGLDATAGEEIASDMELPPDPGSSDFIGPSEIPEPTADFVPYETPEDALDAEQVIQQEQELENEAAKQVIEDFLIDKGIEPGMAGEDEGELTETSVFQDANDLSKSDMEARKQRQIENEKIASGETYQTTGESLTASTTNFINQLAGVDDRMKYTFAWFQDELGLETKSSKLRLAEANAEMDYLNSLSTATIGFTDLGDRKGVVDKVGGGVAALFNAVSSFGASMITSTATFGVGLATDMIGGSIKDFNDQKAETLGITTGELLKTGQGETLIPATLGVFAFALEKRGLNGATKAMNAFAIGKKKGLYGFLQAGTEEGWTEWLQGGIDRANNLIARGEKAANVAGGVLNFLTSKEGLEMALQGFFGGGISSGVGGNVKARMAIRSESENKNITDKVKQISELETSKFKKNLNNSEIAEINAAQERLRADLIVGFKKNDKIINVLNQNEVNDINKNFNIIENSSSRIQEVIASDKYTQQTKDVIVKGLKKDIEAANQSIYDVRNTAEKITQSAEQIKDQAGDIKGLSVESFDSTKEVEDFIKKQNPSQDSSKASEQQGFIVQNPKTGKQTIVINKEIAKKEKAVNVAEHEFLHALLYQTVKNSPETAINLGNELLGELNNIDASQIKDSKFKKRMEQYSDKSKDVQMEEALTLFSDAIATGDIKFQENVFTKMGDAIRRSLQKIGVNVKFNTGRDVYNFVKDYNNSMADGKLNKAQITAAKEGVKGKLIGEQIKESKAEVKESKEIGAEAKKYIDNKEIYDNKSLVNILNSPSSTGVQTGGAVQAIIENNFGLIKGKLGWQNWGSQGITVKGIKDAVEEQILGIAPGRTGEKGGQKGIFDNYNPNIETGGSEVSTRLGDLIGKRTPEILERAKQLEELKKESESTDSERAGQIANPESSNVKEKKQGTLDVSKRFNIQEEVDAVVDKLSANELTESNYKNTINKIESIVDKKLTKQFISQPDNAKTIYNAFPKSIMSDGKATGVKKAILKAFYIESDVRTDATEGKSKQGLTEQVKQPFNKNTWNNFINRRTLPSGKLERINDQLNPRLDAIKKEFGKAATNQARTKILRKEFEGNPNLETVIDFVSDGKSRIMLAKAALEVETNIEPNELNQILGAYQSNRASLTPAQLDIAQDFIEKSAIKEADKGKAAIQFTKGIKNSELPPVLKEGPLFTESDAKFKKNNKAIKEFNKQGQDVASQIFIGKTSNKFKNVILGLFAGHYNVVGSEMAKIGSSFKKGIIKNFNTDSKSVLSKETLNRWENFKWEDLQTSYASKYYTALKKIYKSDNLKEQIKIAKETFNSSQGKASMELNDLWNTTLQEWLYSSSKNSVEFNKKADYILKLKKANSAIGTTGERILAPAGYVFLPGKTVEGTIKFEHLKSSSQQSFESAVLVLQGKWKQEGKKTLKTYNGIFGFLNDFNIIDDNTGKVNDSNIFRFAENLELAKNIYSVKSGFKVSLYDDIVSKVGKKAIKEFETNQNDIKSFNTNILPSNIKFSKSENNNKGVLDKMQSLDKQAQDARVEQGKNKDLNTDFNNIIEKATGITAEKQYGKTKARAVGADKGKWDWAGIPPSAQDFVGLTRYFAGKGKEGDKTIAWIKENFLDPFARANIDISNARVALANDFKALKKLLNVSPKDLNKKITGEPYTVGNAVRVYTWGQQGMKVPGLSKADQKTLEDYVTADENLQLFANELIAINKDNGYPKPQDGWLAGTITTDLLSGLNTVVRAKYLKQWQGNVNEVFNETNLNKLEAAYGKSYREALENILGRMKSGSNRGAMGDTLTGRFVDWLNGSIGAIMFFNMRSAVLQTISAVNFVNWSDNNPLKAAVAFGNQPQYWSDVIKLMNSDYLVERRNGLKINVNEADIAEIAAESKNKAKAFISKLLKLGFLPTQIADSFAIASGGATFYRNRLKSLIKDGMSQKEAEAQAFLDFREIAEESQQSSRPDRISAQQAGPMGRVILAFANTPAQYARLMQKAASDLKNRRGDDKTNISKILYYGAIQNVIFNALQQALFAMAFGDEEPDEEKKNKKYTSIVNGMSDSLLRGLGFHGAAISTLKNAVMKLAEGKKAQDAAIELLDISPPISSKIGKLKSAGRTWDWNKKEIMEKGWSLDNPAYLAAGQVVSAATNVPLDRGIRKLQNLKDASDAENEEWMRVANALGWAKWELEWAKDNNVAFIGKRKIERSKTKSNKRKVKRN